MSRAPVVSDPPLSASETSGIVPSPLGDAEAAGLFTRLTYLTAFRLVIVTTLLAATTWVAFRPGNDYGGTVFAALYGLVTFVYVVSLGYLWLLKRRQQLQSLAYAQVVGDLLVATFLVYVTGGVDSLFTLMYPLAIVNASVLLNRNGAVVAALGSAFMFGGLSWALAYRWILPAAPLTWSSTHPPTRSSR